MKLDIKTKIKTRITRPKPRPRLWLSRSIKTQEYDKTLARDIQVQEQGQGSNVQYQD